MLGRLLSRKPSRKGEGEEEAKVYKKAHLGESLGQLYYNEEFKMWVERGKEDEARAEKAKLSALPPSVGTMSAASSSTSLNTAAADAAAAGIPPVPGGSAWTRGRSLKDRYIATPGAGPPPPSGTGSSSCPPSGKSALLPGSGPASGSGLVPGIPKVPGLPAGPSKPGSFFMPTPAASDTASEAAAAGTNAGDSSSTAGGMSQSQSGMSMDAFVPGGAVSGKQPSFFMPAAPAGGSSGGAAEAGAAEGQGESAAAGAADVSMGSIAAQEPEAMDGRDSSAGGSMAELSRPGNLSFATWTPHAADDGSNAVKSPARRSIGGQQQGAAGHLSYAAAGSNGNHVGYAPYSNGGAYDNAAGKSVDPEGAAAQGQHGSSEWPTQPASSVPAAGAEEGGEAGGYGDWQQQQDPFGQPQDPFGVPVAPPQDAAAAEGGWAGMDAEGGADSNAAAAAGAGYVGAHGYAYNQYSGWEQQGYGYDANAYAQGYQQVAAEGGDAAAQQQQYYGMANGYGTYDSSGYYASGEVSTEQQQQQQQQLDPETSASAAALLPDSAAGEADGAATAAAAAGYGQYAYHQQQHAMQPQQQLAATEQQQQQMPLLLDPVHPELPGISTTLDKQGSDEVGPLWGPNSATAAKRSMSAAAAARHQSAPGSAPHPARYGSGIPSPGGAAGGYLSAPPVRSNSMHTPGVSAAGVNPLLPPHRPSVNGSGSPPLRAESSTLTVPAPAVAGDTSMLTMVRPSSPYARPRSVSPLAGHQGGSGSSPLARGDSGFPIPSPPTQMLGKPGVFVPAPAGGAAAATAEGLAPWQPDAAAAGGAVQQRSSVGGHGEMQGPAFGAPMVLDGYMGTTGSQPFGAGRMLDQHGAAAGSAGGAAAANGNGLLPGAGHRQLDADAAASKGADRLFGPGSMAGGAGSPPWQQQQQQQHGHEQRTHPYDAFLNTQLVNTNWRALHFKQPGKLNRQTPYEEFEMQRAREQEAQEALTPTKKREAFWYRQMEHRRKLPAGSMKPSASEPAHMPSHAAAGRAAAAAPPSPGDSSLSQASNYTDWQQHHNQQQQQQAAAAPPCTPARAVTADAAYAVAGHSPGEEPTPTSKFMPLPPTAEDGSDPAAAAAADALGGSSAGAAPEQQQQQQVASMWVEGSGQEAAAGDGSNWQVEQQQHQYAQYYGTPGVGGEVQPDPNAAYQYPPEYYAQWQEYNAQQGYAQQGYQQGYDQQQDFQQQQQQQGYEQQQPSALDEQMQQQPQQQQRQSLDQQRQHQQQHLQGWGSELEQMPANVQASQQPAAAVAYGDAATDGSAAAAFASTAAGLWGDGIEQQQGQQQQQQLDTATAAAADAAASAWDADAAASNALEVPAEQLALPSADSSAAALAQESHNHEQQQQQQQQQRSARVSLSGSTGGSQPNTAKAAAAASRHIVSSALSRIIQEHEDEAAGAAAAAAGAADPAAAAAAAAGIGGAADGWDGDGWEVDEQVAAAADNEQLEPGHDLYPEVALAAAAADAADGQQQYQAGDVAADAAAAGEGDAAAAAVAPEYPKCWQRMRQRVASAALEDDSVIANRDTFIGYGDWLFWQLPELAADDEDAAAGGGAQQQQQQQAEHVELLEMFGEAQFKAESMADTFRAGGMNLDAVFEQLALSDDGVAELSLL